MSGGQRLNNDVATSSRSSAMVIAVSAILGMLVGFGVAFLLLRRYGYCPVQPICGSPLGQYLLAFAAAPFTGIAFAVVTLRIFENRARTRRDT